MTVTTSKTTWYIDILGNADPRTKNWFLLDNSIVTPMSTIFWYLLFIKYGSQLMKNRKPFELRSVLVCYNFALVVLSIYISTEVILSCLAAGYSFGCDPYNESTIQNPKELRVSSALWLFYASKYVELFDTVAMVLRKKSSQITYLHVIHHAGVLLVMWSVVMFMPGGAAWYAAFINSTIHIVMYFYYGLSAIPSCRGVRSWKRLLTRMQLIQFVSMIVFDLYVTFSDCDYPVMGKCMQYFFPTCIFFLFLNFYIKSYVQRKRLNTNEKDIQIAKNGVSSEDHRKKN